MASTQLLPSDDRRFPSFFRLFWNEIKNMIDPNKSKLYKELGKLLRNDTGDEWFSFAIEVLEDSRKAYMKYVENNEQLLSKKDFLNEEQHLALIKKRADIVYKKVSSTFLYEVMFNKTTIKYLDDLIGKHKDTKFWEHIHLCVPSKYRQSTTTFLKHFFSEEDDKLLDRLVVSFQNMDKLVDLHTKFKSCITTKPDMSLDMRIRYFMRNLPFIESFNDDMFYDLVSCMVDGGHMVAVNILLPDYDVVLKLKQEEKNRLRDEQRNIRHDDEADTQIRLEIRSPSHYRSDHENKKFFYDDEPSRTLILRDYQEELVEYPRLGRNTIVVAPTGAGKTEVCIYVAKEHIEKRELEGKASRVVMLVPKVPLVEQQEIRFRDYLKHRRYISGFHGAMNLAGKQRHDEFLKSDIIIMTPEILWNMFRSVRKDERIYLADVTLLIFDEIHHCGGSHIYKRLCNFIVDYSSCDVQPQILGLTATPLPKNEDNETRAMQHIFELMANTDCHYLSTVVKNIESLERHVSKPDEEFAKCEKPNDNKFQTAIVNVITNIRKEINKDLLALVKETQTSGFYLTQQEITLNCESPSKFIAQLNGLRDKLNKLAGGQIEKMHILVAVEYLIILGRGLMVNELMPCYYAHDFLKKEMSLILERYGTLIAKKFYDSYNIYRNDMERLAEQAEPMNGQIAPVENKPIVAKLLEKIQENFKRKPESRCIIFVQERAMARRLMHYLNSIGIVGAHENVAYVTSTKGGTSGDGMTAEEQRRTLNRFHSGDIKIIVATSVLDEGIDVTACNLIIKYNTSSSAVAKIQRAGRVRARDGKSIFICLNAGVAETEYQAILTGNIMKKCVKIMMGMGPTQIKAYVEQRKKRLCEERKYSKEQKQIEQQKLQGKHYNVLCKTCDKIICDSDYIRADGSHHCIVDERIWDILGISVSSGTKSSKSKSRYVDNEHLLLGSIFCLGKLLIEDLGDYAISDVKPNLPEGGCGACLGDVYKIAGTFFPVLKLGEVKFHENKLGFSDDTDIQSRTKWQSVGEELFYIPELQDRDMRIMLNALNNSKPNQAKMQIKLELAVTRISTVFQKELSRRKTENDRKERIRNSAKIHYTEVTFDNVDQSVISGFGADESDEEENYVESD